jgi:thioredoxin reductase (NADPH)
MGHPEEWLHRRCRRCSPRGHWPIGRATLSIASSASDGIAAATTCGTLDRNGVPFEFYATDSEPGQQIIRDFSIDSGRLPAVIHHDGSVLHDPSFADIATSHGIQTEPSSEIYDLAIVGAGPAGLAVAVYGASEGLRTLVVESLAIGGQAGASSMIRNYLGFLAGLAALAHRAWEQAVLFGAEFVFIQPATELSAHGNPPPESARRRNPG